MDKNSPENVKSVRKVSVISEPICKFSSLSLMSSGISDDKDLTILRPGGFDNRNPRITSISPWFTCTSGFGKTMFRMFMIVMIMAIILHTKPKRAVKMTRRSSMIRVQSVLIWGSVWKDQIYIDLFPKRSHFHNSRAGAKSGKIFHREFCWKPQRFFNQQIMNLDSHIVWL